MRNLTAILVLAFLLALLPVPAAAQDQNLAFQVHKAIETGVAWLKKQQKMPEGHFGESSGPTYGGGGNAYHNKPGIAAFSLFTLLECDVKSNDPVILNGFTFLRKCQPMGTYEHAVMILAIESLYMRVIREQAEKKKDPRERESFLKRNKYAGSIMGDADRAWIAKLVKKLVGWQNAQQGWRYGDLQGNAGKQDVSATQFCIFALKAAQRCGIAVSLDVFYGAAKYMLEAQEATGEVIQQQGAPTGEKGSYVPLSGDKARGWPYMTEGEPREKKAMGGMTGAGLVTLIIAKSVLEKTGYWKVIGKQVDKSIFDGLAWLSKNYTITGNPFGFRGHYYYLYALERVGILGSISLIGGNNWYADGAKYLVQAQRLTVPDKEGFWDVRDEVAPSDILDTCYALLFLKKSTIPVGVEITRGSKN